MADDIIFKLTTVYDGSQLAEGLGASTSVIEQDTAAWKEAFASTNAQWQQSNAELIASIRQLTAEISTIPVTTRIAAEESAGALTLLQRKFVETATTAKVSAGGIGSAFGGLSSLLGAGLVVGFFAHFLDETNKEVIELGNLATKTGFAISSLAGLQLATRELGINFDAVQTSMVRLERAQALAVEGGKAQEQAFARIGLTVKEIKNLSPEELFNTVSGAVQKTASSSDAAASSIALLGKGGAALIPIFKQYGSSIDEVITKMGEESGVTEQAYQQSLRYQKATADLADEIRELAIQVIPSLTDSFSGLRTMWVDSTFAIERMGVEVKHTAQDMATAMNILISYDDAQQKYKDHAFEAAGALAELNRQRAEALGYNKGGGGSEGFDEHRPGAQPRDEPSGTGKINKTDKMEEWRLELQKKEDASNESHIVMLSQELAFWDRILQTAKLSTKEELEIRHSIFTLNKEVTAEMQADVMRGYEEGAKAAGAGSQEEIEFLQRKYDFAVEVYGAISSQAIHAYEEIIAASGRAAQRELKDLEEVSKARAKEAEKEITEEQKRLETIHKEDTTTIERKTKQTVAQEGGGSGAIGSVVQLVAAKGQMQELLASENAFKAESIANAQAISAAKISEINKVRAATLADMQANSQNAQADAEKIKALDREQATAVADEKNKEVEITRQADEQKWNIEQQYAAQVIQSQQQISNQFSGEINKMIFQTRSFHQAMTVLWQDLVSGIIRQMGRIVAEWVTTHIIMAAIAKLFHTQDAKDQTASSTEKTLAVISANIAQVISYAGVAGAAAYAAYAEFPPVAASMAAAAISATLSLGLPLASAEHGFDVPGGGGLTPTLLHPREMVLPSDLAGGVRSMVKNSNTNTSTAAQTIISPRFQFSPTIMGDFDVSKHGEQLWDFTRSKLMRMGLKA